MQILSEQPVAEARCEHATVRKSVLDIGRESVAAIKLTIRSSSEDPVFLQVMEEFPGHVSMADIQVHPGFSPEKWTVSKPSHRMVFETEIPPWGEVETIYGVRATDDELEPYLNDPDIVDARVLGGESRAEMEDDSSTLAARDLPAGERNDQQSNAADEPLDSAPQATPEQADAEPDQIAPNAGDIPGEEADTGPTGPSAVQSPSGDDQGGHVFVHGENRSERGPTRPGERPGESPAATTEASDASGNRRTTPSVLVETLIKGLAEADLSEPQRAALRATLGLDSPDDTAHPPALESAERHLATIATTAEQLVEARRSRDVAVDEVAAKVDQVVSRVDDLRHQLRADADEWAGLQDRIDDMQRTISQLQADEDTLERLEGRVDALEELFEPEEAAAIGEVIAAERVWRQRHDAARPP